MAINFPEFEKWWKHRMGLSETGHTVIPEFFEYKISDVNAYALWTGPDADRSTVAKARWVRGAGLRRGRGIRIRILMREREREARRRRA